MNIKGKTRSLVALVVLLDIVAIVAKRMIEKYSISDTMGFVIIMTLAIAIVVAITFSESAFRRLGEQGNGQLLKLVFYGVSILSIFCIGYGIY
ncbi:hypothetical protein [Levilactobacillus tujiorum]|uniref:Uncharacterized protein n=1 Tax=Levilactobacillus tujiorum TaxID=2912243 RepID=A0ABX1L4S5_9LACO|nr:hypothetical protein [Levilactobacillus tujiorum]MCH5464998.1 hypothetical protein [Levilactobacillus tujiorum]NLR30026.1 hypothetical protein [Levilactobacillus tujiorum]